MNIYQAPSGHQSYPLHDILLHFWWDKYSKPVPIPFKHMPKACILLYCGLIYVCISSEPQTTKSSSLNEHAFFRYVVNVRMYSYCAYHSCPSHIFLRSLMRNQHDSWEDDRVYISSWESWLWVFITKKHIESMSNIDSIDLRSAVDNLRKIRLCFVQ